MADAQTLHRFFDRHSWLWVLNGGLWSLLSFLYFDKIPLPNQLVCLTVLVGMGAFSVSSVASQPRVLKYFLGMLYGTLLLSVLNSWVTTGRGIDSAYDISICVLLGVFWCLLLSSGARFHAVHRRGFELQYDNAHLIASLREQTETAKYAVKIKDRLLANAAHDLRQPVHALAFYTEMLRSEPDSYGEVLPKILLATEFVNSLFNSLFDFAKIQAGTVQPKFEPVPVCQVIDDIRMQYSPAASGKRIAFRQRVAPGYVWTDALLIRRIVGNLMGNAIRYTERGGVLLTTRLRAGSMWIEVWDTRVGIAPEHHAYVFQEFYKASAHEGTEDGFGLGLAIVQRLSDVLGHRVTLRSRPGVGTRMRVELLLSDSTVKLR